MMPCLHDHFLDRQLPSTPLLQFLYLHTMSPIGPTGSSIDVATGWGIKGANEPLGIRPREHGRTAISIGGALTPAMFGPQP